MWYRYRQNNSFGTTEGPAKVVYIAADSAEEANERALSFGLYFNGVSEGLDCGCCGDRWSMQSEPIKNNLLDEMQIDAKYGLNNVAYNK